jgi:hypothetical protein
MWILQDYLYHSQLSMPQLLPIIERLDAIVAILYDLGLTKVLPVSEMPPMHEMLRPEKLHKVREMP